jgi:hypothetical protein
MEFARRDLTGMLLLGRRRFICKIKCEEKKRAKDYCLIWIQLDWTDPPLRHCAAFVWRHSSIAERSAGRGVRCRE